MDISRIDSLQKTYSHALFDDIMPFWLRFGLDEEHGGYFHSLDRDGSAYSTDKTIWGIARGVWVFSRLYNDFGRRSEWLEAATLGMDFLNKHAFDRDGRMFFTTTRDGRPLRKRRYVFSETFGVMAMTEYFRATQDQQYLDRARDLFDMILRYMQTPGALPPKVIPQTRKTRSLGIQMALIDMTREIRLADDTNPRYDQVIDQILEDVFRFHLRPEDHLLLEVVDVDGQPLAHIPEGRLIDPGHSNEIAWFIMEEGVARNDSRLVSSGAAIVDTAMEWGWDKEYGGIYYFMDIEGKPPLQLEWDQKLWWPHAESLYATLLAYHLTGKPHFLDWFEKVHEYTFTHFPDPEYGEWFGYLHRDSTPVSGLKGGLWKHFFHEPRDLMRCLTLLSEMKAGRQ